MSWLKRLFSGWSVPGWVVLLVVGAIELLDWADRLVSAKNKLIAIMPTLHPIIDFLASGTGRLTILIVGLLLLFVSTWKKYNRTPGMIADPQPIFVAIDQLRALLYEGQKLENSFENPESSKPTFSEVDAWNKRAIVCASQIAFEGVIGPPDMARFKKNWDDAACREAEAKLDEHGVLAGLNNNGRVVYRHVYGRVKRLSELIDKIDGESSGFESKPPSQSPVVIHQQPQRSFWHNLQDRANAQATAHHEKERRHRDLLIKVRDLINQTKKGPVKEKYDLLGALIKYSDEIDSEEHLRAILSNLEHEFGNPFNVLEANSNNALNGDWLSFLRDARIASYDINNLNSAFGWAATRWKNSERWKLGRRTMQLRESSASSEEAEKCVNEAAKLLQNNACQVFFSFNAICRARAHLLSSNDELLWVCDELAKHGHKHPFEGLTDHVPTEEWLEFVKAATLRPDIRTEDSGDYLNLAEEWPKLKGRPEPTTEIPLALTVLAEVLRRQGV